MVMSLMVMHIAGIHCMSHYQGHYQQILRMVDSIFPLYGAGKLRLMLSTLSGSMLSWKLLLLQRYLVMRHCPELQEEKPSPFLSKVAPDGIVDIDGISFVSYSNQREGSKVGHHSRRRGKPTLQGSGTFLGNIFIDFKLFFGNVNVSVHFQKAIKRIRSMGYKFSIVRADTIYGNAKNLRFLEKLFLHYIMGINISLLAIQEGIKLFGKLAKVNSKKIVHIGKGSAILYLGKINVAKASEKPMYRFVVLCRRIQRKRKKGKLKVKTYYYAIVTDLPLTARQIFRLYHQRQKIENGFKELRYHYAFGKLVSQKKKNSLKANELWMISKIFAMTMAKMFAYNLLPKRYKSLRLKTLIRRLFANTIFSVQGEKVHLLTKPKRLWHFKRIISKLGQNHFLIKPIKIMV